jgi:hypothetical protein
MALKGSKWKPVPVARKQAGKVTGPLLTLRAGFQPDREAKKGEVGEKA